MRTHIHTHTRAQKCMWVISDTPKRDVVGLVRKSDDSLGFGLWYREEVLEDVAGAETQLNATTCREGGERVRGRGEQWTRGRQHDGMRSVDREQIGDETLRTADRRNEGRKEIGRGWI